LDIEFSLVAIVSAWFMPQSIFLVAVCCVRDYSRDRQARLEDFEPLRIVDMLPAYDHSLGPLPY